MGFGELDNEDGTRNPPMCGQAVITKIMILSNHHKKYKDANKRSDLTSSEKTRVKPKRTMFSRKFATASKSGYDDMVSLEQPQDTESDSSRASSERKKARDSGSDLPAYIVQFDPAELEHIKREKAQPTTEKTQQLPRGRSPLWETTLPTVVEELSFELEDKSVTQMGRPSNDVPSLLSATSSSSSLSASFFERINSIDSMDEQDVKFFDDEAEKTVDRNNETEDNHVISKEVISSPSVANGSNHEIEDKGGNCDIEGKLAESEVTIYSEGVGDVAPVWQSSMSSSEQMELLSAMREMILKQQDAIKDIAEQNMVFKKKLFVCQEEMKEMRQESVDQKVRITRLVLQKEAFESESTWLRSEVHTLKTELAYLKADDELKKRFESLLEDDTKSTSDDSWSSEGTRLEAGVSEATGSFERDILQADSPVSESEGKIVDEREWKRMVTSFDTNDPQPLKLEHTKFVEVTNNPKSLTNLRRDEIYDKAPKPVSSMMGTTHCKETDVAIKPLFNMNRTGYYKEDREPAPGCTGSYEEETERVVRISVIKNSSSTPVMAIAPSTSMSTIAKSATQTPKPSGLNNTDNSMRRKKDEVAEFKNRLGEIQKKRLMRKRSEMLANRTKN